MALAGGSALLTLIVFLGGGVKTPIYNPTLLGYTLLIVKECVVGLIIGFGMNLFFQVYFFVGMMLGMQSGLSMSQVMDPTTNTPVPLLGRFYFLCFSALFIISGGS